MSKKLNINNPLFNSALADEPQEVNPQEEEKKPVGRPVKKDLVREPGVKQGLTEDYTRATFILPVETLENLKAYAYTQDIKIKDALTAIIDKFIAEYEADPENPELLRRGGKKK